MGAAPMPAAPRQLVVVAGGSAAVGTSYVTALLGTAAASTGRSVLVIDGDAGVLPARVRQIAPRFSDYDLVLVDAGSRVATIRDLCGVLGDMPRHGDRVLTVAGTEPVAIAAAYALTKSFLARTPRLEVHLIVNGTDAASAGAIAEHVHVGAQRFLRRPIRFAGHIPDDPALGAAHRAGIPLTETLAGSGCAAAVHEVLGRIVRSTPANIYTPPAAPFPAPLPLEA